MFVRKKKMLLRAARVINSKWSEVSMVSRCFGVIKYYNAGFASR